MSAFDCLDDQPRKVVDRRRIAARARIVVRGVAPLLGPTTYLASVLVTDYATKRIGNPSAICRGQS
jgi:hypothetical protein